MTAKLRKMVHIALFTGLRRSRDKKMEASRERNGCTHPDTSETGRKTRKMVLAFNFTTMATSTKDCGKEISAMARVLTGATKLASFAVSTQETGMKIRNTAEVMSTTSAKRKKKRRREKASARARRARAPTTRRR